MEHIVYVPLDERPCNYRYPQKLAKLAEVPIRVPDAGMLGKKKHPADVDRLSTWLREACDEASHLIVSVDMLVYGGIVPSRLHRLSEQECRNRLGVLKEIRRLHPELKIFAFNLIMRTPAYNSSEEEPDFYAEFGSRIFRYGWLTDKSGSGRLTAEEEAEREDILRTVPPVVLAEFTERRRINAAVNHHALQLVEEGVIDLMVYPQDDNARYGYTSMEQKALFLEVDRRELFPKVYIYPGADEVGCTLFARAFCEQRDHRPEAWVTYSSTAGPSIIPKYEDRSLNESVKSHLLVSGAYAADGASSADFVLMVHSPAIGEHQVAETSIALADRHPSYFSEIHYKAFAAALKRYAEKGHVIGLADVAVCNGGDNVLMKILASQGSLSRIAAYAGWNTSGNTMGTVIAHSIVMAYRKKRQEPTDNRFLVERLIEDWGYQSLVREAICAGPLQDLGASYFELSHVKEGVLALIEQQLNDFTQQYLPEFKGVHVTRTELPWDRMFEVAFDIEGSS